jgi:hypothetical protein
MRTKLARLAMSMVVVFALAIEGLAIPYFSQENTNQSGTTTTRRRSPRRSASRANRNTGDATQTTPAATEQTTPPATETMAPAPRQRRRARRGGRRMMAGVPMGVDNCLNHLAQMASGDPLIEYEGHPSEIINNGLLWNDAKSKCAVTDQAQREKIFELATAWRMKDASKVRSLLTELGATAPSATTDAGATPGTMAPRRGRRRARPATETTAPETTAPATTPETQAAPETGAANENANRGTRRGRRGGRRGRTNSNTANTNSGF